MVKLTRRQRAFRNGLQAIWDYHSLPPMQPLSQTLQTLRTDRLLLAWGPRLWTRICELADAGFLKEDDRATDRHRPLIHLGVDYPTARKGMAWRETIPVLSMQLIAHRVTVTGQTLDFLEADIDIGGPGAIAAALRDERRQDLVHGVAGVFGLLLHGVEFGAHSLIRKVTRDLGFGNSPFVTNALLRHVRRLPVVKLSKEGLV